MTFVLKNIPVGKITEELNKRGLSSQATVTVMVDEDFRTVAAEIRALAQQRGMTDELFDELMKDES